MPMTQTQQIAQLNDSIRQGLQKLMVSRLLLETIGPALPLLLKQVQTFSNFTSDNDPYGEHDFGAIQFEGHKIFWKIDTFADSSLTYGADDPPPP